MATIELLYGTEAQTITITLAGLATSAYRASTKIANAGTNGPLYTDALVQLQIKTNAAGTIGTGVVKVYTYGTANLAGTGGPLYPDTITGVDAAITPGSPANSTLVYTLNANVNATTYVSQPFSIAQAFNNILPEYWGIMVLNSTGAALDSTASNFIAIYQGIYNQSV